MACGSQIGGSPFLSNDTIHVAAAAAAAAVKKKKKTTFIKAAVAVSNSQTRDRMQLKQLFREAYERCRTSPLDGVPFTLEDFHAAIDLPIHVEEEEEEAGIVPDDTFILSLHDLDTQTQLGIGSVVTGTVESLKPYGAFIHIGGINGLLHVSQISHDRVSDIPTVLQPGDILKVMVLSHDRERGRLTLSTKILEPTPGDMIRNPNLVFEKAEEMAHTFRQRIAQAEAMARAGFQPESADLLAAGLDFNEIP